jgi:hypothetical protein
MNFFKGFFHALPISILLWILIILLVRGIAALLK